MRPRDPHRTLKIPGLAYRGNRIKKTEQGFHIGAIFLLFWGEKLNFRPLKVQIPYFFGRNVFVGLKSIGIDTYIMYF